MSGFDTSGVTNMQSMFYNCEKLTSIDVRNFDTSNVIKMAWVFANCENLVSIDVSEWNTSNVMYMEYMFWNCISLTNVDVSKWDTSKVTSMQAMFSAQSDKIMKLTNIDVSKFDTGKVINMEYMFKNCIKLSTTITIKNAGTISYADMFLGAATEPGASITVNYTNATSSLVDSMIATKSSNSNVVKGSLVS